MSQRASHAGSLYSFDEIKNIAQRFKADFTKDDAGLQPPLLAVFLNDKQAKQALNLYDGIYADFDTPVLGVLSPRFVPEAHNHVFDGSGLILGIKDRFKEIIDFSETTADDIVHFIVRKNENEGPLTSEWHSLGRVERKPAVGLTPFEIHPYRGLFHVGNKIAEVYDNASELAASIERHGYPVRIGSKGHLEYPAAAVLDNGKSRSMVIRREDGLYAPVEALRDGSVRLGKALKLEFGNSTTVRVTADGAEETRQLKMIYDSATITGRTVAINITKCSVSQLSFKRDAGGKISAEVRSPNGPDSVLTLDPNNF